MLRGPRDGQLGRCRNQPEQLQGESERRVAGLKARIERS
jgi:hypothetical protein